MRHLMIFVLLSLVATPSPSWGAKAKKSGSQKSGAQKPGLSIGDAIHKLQSPNPEEVMYAVQVLAASGSRRAAGPLADLLRTGPRNDVTNSIIQALGSIGDVKSIPILIEYLGHRRPDTRVASIWALESFDDQRVTTALENALRDSDSQVRSTAALALGKRGKAASVPILFLAFDRGVTDSAISIGQLGTPADAKRLAGYLGRSDVRILLPGFDEFLRRADFPAASKLEILNQLFELAGPEVRRFAVAYKASFPPDTKADNNKLYKMVSRMVRQIQED